MVGHGLHRLHGFKCKIQFEISRILVEASAALKYGVGWNTDCWFGSCAGFMVGHGLHGLHGFKCKIQFDIARITVGASAMLKQGVRVYTGFGFVAMLKQGVRGYNGSGFVLALKQGLGFRFTIGLVANSASAALKYGVGWYTGNRLNCSVETRVGGVCLVFIGFEKDSFD